MTKGPHRPLAPFNGAQSAFSIVDALVVLAAMSVVIVVVSQYFLGSKDQVSYRRSRTGFEEEMARLVMATEENTMCEELSFVGSVSLGSAPEQVLASIDDLKVGGVTLMKTGREKKKRYEIKKIELIQKSIVFGENPKRAIADIVVTAEFYDAKGNVSKQLKSDEHKVKAMTLMLASGSGGAISSCYGAFSRRIACEDFKGTYDPESQPNCVK